MGALAGVAVLHLVFLVLDERVPGDRALMFQALGAAYGQWAHPSPELLRLLSEPTGWFNVLLAGLLRLAGPSSGLVRAVCMGWSLAVVGLSGLLARRLAGPRAALVAVALLSTSNLVVGLGRIVWFHIPEAALVLGLAALLVGDPQLRWRRSPWLLAVGGVAVLTLRNTGGFWLATLLPLIWPALSARRWPLAGVVAAWALGALVPLRTLRVYLDRKLQARDLYQELVPPLAEQLQAHFGWLTFALFVGAALLGAWQLRERRGPLVVLLAWVVAPLVLVGVFRSGIENHDLFAPALACLGGVALAGRPRGTGLALAAVVIWQGLSLGLDREQRRPLAGWVLPGDEEPVLDFQRPFDGVGEPELSALMAATCTSQSPRSCLVVAHQGLFYPFSGSAGELELFLMGHEEVFLLPLHRRRVEQIRETPSALAETRCSGGQRQELWLRQHPDSAQKLEAAVRRWGLVEVWRAPSGDDCELVWSTPGGALARPELLPPR